MPISEATINKLENLLKLAKHEGTGKEEAQAAMLAAQRLAARHQLDLSEFELSSEEKEGIEVAEIKIMKNMSPWRYNVAEVIARNFRCRVVQSTSYFRNYERRLALVYIGLKSDVQIAKRVGSFAIEFGESGVVSYAKGGLFNISGTHKEAREIRDSWLHGYVAGIREAFAKQVSENTELALMIVEPPEVSEYFDTLKTHKVELNQPQASIVMAASDGYQKGRTFTGPQEQLT